MHEAGSIFILESTIELVDVQVIIFVKIVADVHIRIAIHIDVGNANTQTITNYRTVDTSSFCNIDKLACTIISIQMITRYRACRVEHLCTRAKSAVLMNGVVE